MPRLGPESAYIFRITHVDNVPWIFRNGVHCRSGPSFNPNFVSIGSADLIGRRRSRNVPIPPGGSLSDYVPFYFTPWSIMLYNIRTGFGGVTKHENRDIVIIVSSLHRLAQAGTRFVFTSAHAYMLEAEFFSELKDLNRVDWNILRERDFKLDPDDPGKKGRYQAEALVYRHVPVGVLLGVACYDAVTQSRLEREAEGAGITVPIKALPDWYFR